MQLVTHSAPEIEVPRDNLVQLISASIRRGHALIFVCGDPGIGVSTVLQQFAKTSVPTVSLFLRTGNRLGYDPSLVLLKLCAQLASILDVPAPDLDVTLARSLLPRLLLTLEKKSNHGSAVNFVVDGLHQLPSSDSVLQSEIIAFLPVGQPGCRFVFAGTPEVLPASLRRHLEAPTHTMPGFTFDEAKAFLSSSGLDDLVLREILRNSGCNPSVLSSVRRLLHDGKKATEIVPALSDHPPELFKLEWARSTFDATDLNVLALLANDEIPRGVRELAQIISVDTHDLEERVARLRFLSIQPGGAVAFISPMFKDFAYRQLEKLRSRALGFLVAYQLKNPDDPVSLAELPRHFAALQQHMELLDYLSPTRFSASVRHLGSTAMVQQRASAAIQAAFGLKRFDDLVRFSLHATTVSNLHAAEPTGWQVRALLALGQHEKAVAVAESATMTETRLRLLARVGRQMREDGQPASEHVTATISRLYHEIQVTNLPYDERELAEDLLFVSPQLGLQLLDEIAKQHADKAAWLYATASIGLSLSPGSGSVPSEVANDLQERIRDPDARALAAYATSIFANYAGKKLLAEAMRLPQRKDAFRLIGDWIATHSEHVDVLWVLSEALHAITRATDYVPEARVVRQLARVIELHADDPASPSLVSRLEDLSHSIERLGPSTEHVRIQLSLAGADWDRNRLDAITRIGKVLLFCVDIKDESTRAACFAYMHTKLRRMDPDTLLNIDDGTHTLVSAGLQAAIDAVINSTAEPHKSLAESINALATSDVELAKMTILRYNSISRRDAGLQQLVDARKRTSPLDLISTQRIIPLIADARRKDDCKVAVLERVLASSSLDFDQDRLRELLCECTDTRASVRFRACALAMAVSRKHGIKNATLGGQGLEQELQRSYEAMEPNWRKVEAGFEIAARLATYEPELARVYFEEASKDQEGMAFDTHTRSETYFFCTKLAVRAYAGLLLKRRDTEGDLRDICDLIDLVGSRIERIHIFTELGLRFSVARRLDECSRVCKDFVRPLLEEIKALDPDEFPLALIESGPLLFQCHATSALEQIQRLGPEKDDALYAIARFIMTRVPPMDPCATPFEYVYRSIVYDDVVDLLHIAELLSDDSMIFLIVKAIGSTVASRKDDFTREQKSHIKTRLIELSKRFPLPGYVPHHGYSIATRAYSAKLDRYHEGNWQQLVAEAKDVPNSSDSAFVLLIIAECMKPCAMRSEILQDAENAILSLNSFSDRFTRLGDLADTLVPIDRAHAKRVLETAKKVWLDDRDHMIATSPKRFIDIASRLDEDIASTLAAAFDDDPARIRSTFSARSHLDKLDLAKKICEPSVVTDKTNQAPAAAWSALGDLNAGMRAPLQGSEVWSLFQSCAVLPLRSSYPFMSLAIASACQRFGGSPQSLEIVRSILAGVVVAARVTGDVAAKMVKSTPPPADAESAGLFVAPGRRNEAYEYLRSWLEASVSDSLTICDPYFGLGDLEALKLVAAVAPTAEIQIITSRKALASVALPHDETFRAHWQLLSNDEPPHAEIVTLGTEPSGDSPIHDRWWLTRSAGIRLGTSFNGLGARESEISVMTAGQHAEARALVERHTKQRRAVFKGARVHHAMFTL